MKKIFFLSTFLLTFTFSASFDCSKATTNVEKLICSNEELSQLDDKLQESYKFLRTYLTFEEDYTCGRYSLYEESSDLGACKMDKDLRLDDELIETYSTFIAKNKNELKKQREWLKQTKLCKDKECIKQAYETRIEELNKEIKTISSNLLKAQKKAKESFKQTNSIIEPIHIFDRVNTNALIRTKPLFLTDKEYVNILHDYAYYLTLRAGTKIYETDRPVWEIHNELVESWNYDMGKGIRYIFSDGRRLHEAIRALLKAKEINPNDVNVSKLLAKTYLKLLVFERAGSMCPRSRDCFWTTISHEKIPYLMKQAYLDYVNLSKANGIKPELDEIEQAIVNRQRMFYEVMSSFAGDADFGRYYHITEDHIDDPKFTNICKEYVAMLNKLPDNNLTLCSRYANEKNSLFEFVTYDDAPDEYKEYTISHPHYPGSLNIYRSTFLVKYKDTYFTDGYDELKLIFDTKGKNRVQDNFCAYQYIDFSFKDQREMFIEEDCSRIGNYDQIYKNGKE